MFRFKLFYLRPRAFENFKLKEVCLPYRAESLKNEIY